MNRAQVAREILLKNIGRKVSIRMLTEAGINFYVARNAAAEAKATFDPKEYTLRHVYHAKGEQVADNGWVLEKISSAGAQAAKAVVYSAFPTDERSCSGGSTEAHEASANHPPAPHISNTNQHQLPL